MSEPSGSAPLKIPSLAPWPGKPRPPPDRPTRTDGNAGLNDAISTLIVTMERFTASSDRYSTRLVRLTIVLVVLTVVLLVLAGVTVWEEYESASLQTNIALNGQFFSRPNLDVRTAIDRGGPILQEHGGLSTPTDLDTYLGTYDVILSAYDRHLLSEADLCMSFSNFIDDATNDEEIRAYIAKWRKYDNRWFQGFVDLQKIITKSKDPTCHGPTHK
jgi:hypothetical protein